MRQRAIAWSFAGAALVLVVVACGGSSGGDVPGDAVSDGGSAETSRGGPGVDGATGSDATSGVDAAPQPDAAPGGVCKVDADCNDDPNASSLGGACYTKAGFAVCICKSGFHVQPSGKCGRQATSDCATQGGMCVQNTSMCPAATIPGSGEAAQSCGDFVPAACCFAPAKCKGPAFSCCSAAGQASPPICENGYLTCPAGASALAPGGTCS